MAVLITLLSPALTDTSDESSRSSLRICLLGYSGNILNVGEYVTYVQSWKDLGEKLPRREDLVATRALKTSIKPHEP